MLCPFSVSGGDTPRSRANCVQVLISPVLNFPIKSKSAHVLKALPSLLGGVRNSFTSSDVSVERVKLGLQYRMKLANASSKVSSDTSWEGSDRSSGAQLGLGCLLWLEGVAAAEKRGEAFEGVDGGCELRAMSP